MIIDIHRHIVGEGFFSEKFWKGYARMVIQYFKRWGIDTDVAMILANIVPTHYDVDGEKHIAAMSEAGIDKTAMFLLDTGLLIGEGDVSIEEQNEIIFKLAKKYPDKIIPFVTIDPRRPKAVEFVKMALEEWGAKGLKIHPGGGGFNPEEKETLDLIESIADYGIPVITHTGASISPTSSRYCDPIYLDKMLLEFPEVNVIAAHMGAGYRHQLFDLATVRPNLYTEISMWQPVARERFNDFAQTIKDAVAHFGPERILFGTDSPYYWLFMPEPAYVKKVKNLAIHPPENERLTSEEVDMILGKNAQVLLGLS